MYARTTFIILLLSALALPLFLAGAVRLRADRGGRTKNHVTTRLVCAQPTYDFGPIAAAEAAGLAHDFVIENVSDRAVRILDKSTNCGCTSADTKGEIRPGEKVRVVLKADWGGRNGTQLARVVLRTDEGAGSEVTLSFSATVVNPVNVFPRALEFLDVDPGISREQTFEVKQLSDQAPFVITDIQSTNPAVRVRRPAGLHLAGKPGKFFVDVAAPRSKLSWLSRINIRTSLGTAYAVNVRVRTNGAIQTSPRSIVFDQGHSLAQIRVSVFAGAPVGQRQAIAISSPAQAIPCTRCDRQRSGLEIAAAISRRTVECLWHPHPSR